MARKAALYAKALVQTLDKAPAKDHGSIVRRFKELVTKRGDLKLLSSIVKEFERQWEARKGTVARLVTAQESFVGAKVKKELSAQGYTVREERDARLIGGAAAFLGTDYLLDNSVRGRLKMLQSMLKK